MTISRLEPWKLDAPEALRSAYAEALRRSNAERLRAVALIVAIMFLCLLGQHFVSPGLASTDPLYKAYLAIHLFFIGIAIAYLIAERTLSLARDSSLAQWMLVLSILGGSAALAVLDYKVSGDLTALLLGLIAVAVFFRCRVQFFALSATVTLVAFATSAAITTGKALSPATLVPVVIDILVTTVFSVALGHYDIRTFTLQRELEEAKKRLEDDILRKERDARELGKALAERAALFQELQHRVKNSLAMVSSLLSLDEQRLDDETSKEIMRQAQGRLQTMAAIYEQLYRSGALDTVDFGKHAAELVDMFLEANSDASRRIRVELRLQALDLDLKRAIPLGLIVNELLTNSFKHAFPGERTGRILVALEPGKDRAIIRIEDDGVGMPPGFVHRVSDSLGLKLVDLLVAQIDAELLMPEGQGTRFEISFAIPGAPARTPLEQGVR